MGEVVVDRDVRTEHRRPEFSGQERRAFGVRFGREVRGEEAQQFTDGRRREDDGPFTRIDRGWGARFACDPRRLAAQSVAVERTDVARIAFGKARRINAVHLHVGAGLGPIEGELRPGRRRDRQPVARGHRVARRPQPLARPAEDRAGNRGAARRGRIGRRVRERARRRGERGRTGEFRHDAFARRERGDRTCARANIVERGRIERVGRGDPDAAVDDRAHSHRGIGRIDILVDGFVGEARQRRARAFNGHFDRVGARPREHRRGDLRAFVRRQSRPRRSRCGSGPARRLVSCDRSASVRLCRNWAYPTRTTMPRRRWRRSYSKTAASRRRTSDS